jgi:hypothetical protein
MQPSTEAIRTAIAALAALLPQLPDVAPPAQPRHSLAYDRVLAFVLRRERTSSTEIRITLRLTPALVSHALRDLVREGILARTTELAPRVHGRGPRACYLELTPRGANLRATRGVQQDGAEPTPGSGADVQRRSTRAQAH